MACPTCDHTMHLLLDVDGEEQIFWCQRCGTVKVQRSSLPHEIVHTPMLVQRCQEFQVRVLAGPGTPHGRLWRTLGVAESINLPEHRGAFQ